MIKNLENLSETQIRGKLTDIVVWSAAVLLVIILTSSLFRIHENGILPITYFHIFIATTFFLLGILRKKINKLTIARIVCAGFFFAGAASLHTFGLTGSGIMLLASSSIISALLLNTRTAVAVLIAGGLIIIAYPVLVNIGAFQFAGYQGPYQLTYSAWLSAFMTYCYLSSITIFSLFHLYKHLKSVLSDRNEEIRHKESRIRDSEAILHTILDTLPYGIAWKDNKRRYVGANTKYVIDLGFRTESEIVNKTDLELGVPDNQFHSKDAAIISGETDFMHYEVDIKTDSIVRTFDEMRVALKDKYQKLIGVVISYTDITDFKELQLQTQKSRLEAEAANKAKSEFLANISHELRTPLNGVLGLLELSLAAPSDSQDYYVKKANVCAKMLHEILSDVLDITQIESGLILLEQDHFNFSEVITQIDILFSTQAESKGIVFESIWDGPKTLTVVGDKSRITQIMVNLCSNAVKFTQNGKITLSVKITLRGGIADLVVKLADTGVGMDQKTIDTLFDDFTQEEGHSARKFGGLGLGVSIVKSLVDMMGGEISVESKKSQGSRFTVSLALPVRTEKTNPAAQIEQVDYSQLKVLVVDDNEINQEIARALLESEGIGVEVADDGQKAIAILENAVFDMVFMDIQMPIMDGCETVELLRKEEQWSQQNQPIVALTANVMSSDIERYLHVGFTDCLGKPFDKQKLLSAIKKHCKSNKIQ